MKALKYKKIEGCLDGTNVWDILLDTKIDSEFVETLGKMGKLILKDQFKKPYFKIIVRGEYSIKGSYGNKSLRLVLLPDSDTGPLDKVMSFINSL